jgi:hypothetical protein
MISIDGLQAFADRLSRLDLGRAGAEALKQAAHSLAGSINAAASPPVGQSGPRRRENDAMPGADVSCRIREHSVVIAAAVPALVEREVGSTSNPPDPIQSATARQSAPAIAERIGQMFVRVMSDMENG